MYIESLLGFYTIFTLFLSFTLFLYLYWFSIDICKLCPNLRFFRYTYTRNYQTILLLLPQ